jgi:photosystem II stability/assembly factor-like uncharacterized protein
VPPSRHLLVGLAALVAAACGGADAPAAGSLPGSDHLHALRAAADGSLLLGLHGALWRSDDGTDWEQLGLEGQDAMALGVAADDAPLLVGGHDVLARSTDGGETFEMLAPDLPSLDIHALAQAPGNPDLVYAYVVGAGIYRSLDAGDTWVPAATVGDRLPGDLAALAVDPREPGTVLAGSASAGVFRSTDEAATFERTGEWGTLGLAFGQDGQVLAATARGVDVSEDAGDSWTSVAAADQFDGQPLAVAIAGDGTRWMMTEDPRVLYRSDGSDFAEVARA